MHTQIVPDFIVIDDDPFYNILCRRCIEISFPSASVKTFTDPVFGLEHIQSTYKDPAANKVFVFLDINMPALNGWEVLNKIINYPETVKKYLTVFIMSSSVAISDKQSAEENPFVSGYIEKPLTRLHLQTMLPLV